MFVAFTESGRDAAFALLLSVPYGSQRSERTNGRQKEAHRRTGSKRAQRVILGLFCYYFPEAFVNVLASEPIGNSETRKLHLETFIASSSSRFLASQHPDLSRTVNARLGSVITVALILYSHVRPLDYYSNPVMSYDSDKKPQDAFQLAHLKSSLCSKICAACGFCAPKS